MKVGKERRKGLVQRPFTSGPRAPRDLPGSAGSREDEAPSGGEGTAQFRGPVR